MSNNRKKDSATAAAHIKKIIELWKNKCLGDGVSNRWKNMDGCAEHCRCNTALFLLSVLLESHNRNIEYGISAPGHRREVVYGLNNTDKRFIFHGIATVQLPGNK